MSRSQTDNAIILKHADMSIGQSVIAGVQKALCYFKIILRFRATPLWVISMTDTMYIKKWETEGKKRINCLPDMR